MKSKHLIGLAAVAVIAVAGAVAVSFTGSNSGPDMPATARLFPGLADKINDASQIIVARKSETVTIDKKGDTWVVAEKHDYPAAFDKVRKLLVDLTELRPLEQKTSNPVLFRDLELEDLSQPAAKSALVTVKAASGQDLAALYVGKERLARGGTGGDATYVRKSGENQTWLARGRLALENGAIGWLDRQILDVPHERVAKAVIAQPNGGPVVTVTRAKATDKDFALAGMPKGKKAKSEWDVNQVASPLESLELDDVLPAADVAVPDKGGYAEFDTFDGLVVRIDLAPKDDKTWVRLSAKYVAPATAPTDDETKAGKLKSADDVKKEVEALNAKAASWAYRVPDWKLDILRKKVDDLVEDEKKDAKKGS